MNISNNSIKFKLLPHVPYTPIYELINNNITRKAKTSQKNVTLTVFADGLDYLYDKEKTTPPVIELPFQLDDGYFVPEIEIPNIPEVQVKKIKLFSTTNDTIDEKYKLLLIPFTSLKNKNQLVDKFGLYSEYFMINWYKMLVYSLIFNDLYPWNIFLNLNKHLIKVNNSNEIAATRELLKTPFQWLDVYNIITKHDVNFIIVFDCSAYLYLNNINYNTHILRFINRKNINYIKAIEHSELMSLLAY